MFLLFFNKLNENIVLTFTIILVTFCVGEARSKNYEVEVNILETDRIQDFSLNKFSEEEAYFLTKEYGQLTPNQLKLKLVGKKNSSVATTDYIFSIDGIGHFTPYLDIDYSGGCRIRIHEGGPRSTDYTVTIGDGEYFYFQHTVSLIDKDKIIIDIRNDNVFSTAKDCEFDLSAE